MDSPQYRLAIVENVRLYVTVLAEGVVCALPHFIVELKSILDMEKKVLTLTVSKEWFDLIKDGTKDEEYREIKPYWMHRLFYVLEDEKGKPCNITTDSAGLLGLMDYKKFLEDGLVKFVPYTHVLFCLGYAKDRQTIEKEIVSITIGKPKKGLCPDEWLDTEFFIIKFK